MKKDLNFWLSLEEYLRKLARRSPLPWRWVGLGITMIVFVVSSLNVKNSMVGVDTTREAIEKAVSRGDYDTARQLLTTQQTNKLTNSNVLGVGSELEDKVYPEKVVERKISDLETKLEIYPGNREIYQQLASLYEQLDNQEKSSEYLEKARVLDPNGVEF